MEGAQMDTANAVENEGGNAVGNDLKDLFFKQEFDAQTWNRHINAFVEGIFRVVEEHEGIDLEGQAQAIMGSQPMKDQKNQLKQFIIAELSRIEQATERFLAIKLRGLEFENGQLYDLLTQTFAFSQLMADRLPRPASNAEKAAVPEPN